MNNNELIFQIKGEINLIDFDTLSNQNFNIIFNILTNIIALETINKKNE